MSAYAVYNFGVEIEAVLQPYSSPQGLSNREWYRKLAERLLNRNIPAVADDLQEYRKHPEYYGRNWFVTKDGSLDRANPKPLGTVEMNRR
jgi:hypothetical protein